MRNLLLFLFLSASISAYSQNHKDAISSINTIEDAETYADEFDEVSIVFLHEELENSTYIDMKDTLKVGDGFSMQFYRLKVVALGEKELFHCRYIFINEFELEEGQAKKNQDLIVNKLSNGDAFEDLHAKYSMDKNLNVGDLGWIDPDHMAEGFRDALIMHKNGDVFKCSEDSLGWHYVVEVTDKPKKINGHYVLVYPEITNIGNDQNIEHEANLKELNSANEMRDYARKNSAVNIHLFNSVNDMQFFRNLEELKEQSEVIVGNKVDIEGTRYVILKDTTVALYTFQYIFIDGTKLSIEERKRRINDIYTRYNGGEEFQSLVNAYWAENKEYSTMTNIDGALLMPELLAQLNIKKPGELFVARTSQSYFIGIPLEEVTIAEGYVAISYPIMVN
ncbi:MAG: Zn/Cd-binding protein ZinT [Salibacteraceae bacterium]|jgi:Zn/Cd-binding protein ZinT